MTRLLMTWLALSAANPAAVQLAEEAAILVAQRNYRQAAAKLAEAQALAPEDAVIAYNLGEVREADGDLQGAAWAFDRYLAAAPGASDAAEVRERIAALRDGARLPPAAREHALSAQTHLRAHRAAEAEREMLEAARLAPSWGPAQWNLGLAHEAARNWSEAIRAYRRHLAAAAPEARAAVQARIAACEAAGEHDRQAALEAARRDEQARLAAEQRAAAEAARAAAAAHAREAKRARAEAAHQQREDRERASKRNSRHAGAVIFISLGLVAGGMAGFFGYLYTQDTAGGRSGAAHRDMLVAIGLGAGGALGLIIGIGFAIAKASVPEPGVRVTVAPGLGGGTVTVSF